MARSGVLESVLYKAGKLVFPFINHPGKFPPDQAGTIGFTYSADSSDSVHPRLAKIYKLSGKKPPHICIITEENELKILASLRKSQILLKKNTTI